MAEPLPLQFVPCCVPYWEERSFLRAGGSFDAAHGFHTDLTRVSKEEVFDWLPRRWQVAPGAPVLLPEMLPSSVWENNVRTQLSEQSWDRIRRFCYQHAGHRCQACGSSGEPHIEAHEQWRFHEPSGVQELIALYCLCPTCHRAKHIGLARRQGILNQVHARLRLLNGWSDEQIERALEQAADIAEKQSSRTWRLDLSLLKRLGLAS